MNWGLAVEQNREALLRLLVLVLSGLGGVVTRVKRLEVLSVLRPAEAATRRLIAILARGMSVRLRAGTPCPSVIPSSQGAGARLAGFRLLDPLRLVGRATRSDPRAKGLQIRVIGGEYWAAAAAVKPAASVEAAVDTTRLIARLEALQRALDDLPAQARRLARWHAKRRARGGPGRVSALRTGRPPGHRARPNRPVDILLRDCHELARHALTAPDTS